MSPVTRSTEQGKSNRQRKAEPTHPRLEIFLKWSSCLILPMFCFVSFFFPEKASVSPSRFFILTEKIFPSYTLWLTPFWLLPQTVNLHLLMGPEPISLNFQGILAGPGEQGRAFTSSPCKLPRVVQPGLTFTSSSCLPSVRPHFSSLCCYCLPFPSTSPLFSHVHIPLFSLAPAPARGHVAWWQHCLFTRSMYHSCSSKRR